MKSINELRVIDELLLIISYFWHFTSKPHLKVSDIKCYIKSQSLQHFPKAMNISTVRHFVPTKRTVVLTNFCEFLLSSFTNHVGQVLGLIYILCGTKNLFLNIIICHQTVMLYFPCTLSPYWCMKRLCWDSG